MTLLNIAACLLILACVSYAMPKTVRITDPFQITSHIQGRSLLNDVKPVPGRRSCGGTGRVREVRYEQCNDGGPQICVMSHENSGRAEMVFVPKASSKGLGFIFRIFATGGGEPRTITIEKTFPDVSIDAGKEYVLTAMGGPTPELKGKHVTTQWEISRMVDKQVEVCSEQDLYIK